MQPISPHGRLQPVDGCTEVNVCLRLSLALLEFLVPSLAVLMLVDGLNSGEDGTRRRTNHQEGSSSPDELDSFFD